MKPSGIIIVSRSRTVADIVKSFIGEIEEVDVSMISHNNALNNRLRVSSPKLVFVEACFMGRATCDLINRLTRRDHNLRIAAFTIQESPAYEVAKFIYWGALGYLNLRDDTRVIREAMRKILRGEAYYPEEAAERVESFDEKKPAEDGKLTEREREIVKLIVDKKTNRQIGETLNLSYYTINAHRGNILKKIGGHGAVDIVLYGIVHGIVDTPDYWDEQVPHLEGAC
jgi:DNA-binding NarL/FixJ family response regulator